MPEENPEAAASHRVMPERVSSDARWDQRIARARTLAVEHPAAHQALTFYAALAAYQKTLAIGSAAADMPDLEPVLAAIPAFLTWLSREAPAPLAAAAVEMLGSHLDLDPNAPDPNARFVAEALLQPFAEQGNLPNTTLPTERAIFPARCPACGALPVLAVLREEGHGAKRTLLCSLCFAEWDYRRILCPNCGEQQFDALPVYTAEQFEHVRIEACTRCQRYIKTIDLTKNGLAVPPVDDIASVSLDLWAREQGYVRIKENLLAL